MWECVVLVCGSHDVVFFGLEVCLVSLCCCLVLLGSVGWGCFWLSPLPLTNGTRTHTYVVDGWPVRDLRE